jgi:iron complex outermembrane receptor protein
MVPQSVSRLSNDAVTPRFTADYRWTETVMTYVSASRGVKSGGFSTYDELPPGAVAPIPFQAEHVWAYEAGIKADLFDHRVRLDQSVFHDDYTNLQVRIPDQYGFVTVRNAATATINGAELEASLKPVPEADIIVGIARLAAQYDKFAYTLGPVTVDDSGKYLIQAPRWKGSIVAQYAFALEDWATLTPRLEYSFEGRSFYDDTNSAVYSHGWLNLYNLRLTLRPNGGPWSATLYAQNLTNKIYIDYSVAILGNPIGSPNEPRTIGLAVRYDW